MRFLLTLTHKHLPWNPKISNFSVREIAQVKETLQQKTQRLCREYREKISTSILKFE